MGFPDDVIPLCMCSKAVSFVELQKRSSFCVVGVGWPGVVAGGPCFRLCVSLALKSYEFRRKITTYKSM